jgi:signal transduction histidine kinase
MNRRVSSRTRLTFGVGCVLAALLVVGAGAVIFGPSSWGSYVTGSALSTVAGLLACGSCVYAARRARRVMRRAWMLLAAMSLLYSTGDVLWLVFADAAPGSVVLTAADSLYLAALLPAVAALLLYPTARGLKRSWLPLALDGLVLGLSALLISDVLALAGVADATSGFETFVYVVFPITTVLLASLVLLLLVRSVGAVRPDVVLLGLTFATYAIADIGYAHSTVRDEAFGGTVYEFAYVVAPLLLALAALTTTFFDTSTRVLQRHLSGPVAQLLPDFAAFVALALCLTVGLSGDMQVGLIAALLVMVGLRQMTVTSQNFRLRHDLERTIAERTQDLVLITEEHRRLDAMKQEFVSAVSHELRTPLTAIRGSLEMLAEGDAGELPLRARRVVEIATRGSERLSRLVDDIIDLERLESGTFGIHPAPCDLATLLLDATESLAPLSREAGVRVLVSPVETRVECDSDRVTQALVNLVGNALKFTAPGGTVTVRAEPTGEEVLVSVADTGRGIPRDELGAIFEPFHQVDPDEARQDPGTGLGLSITQRIVEAHGGTIWAESVLGEGSTFRFTLPLGSSRSQHLADADDVDRADAPGDRRAQLTA